jgi:hypothetical protein
MIEADRLRGAFIQKESSDQKKGRFLSTSSWAEQSEVHNDTDADT